MNDEQQHILEEAVLTEKKRIENIMVKVMDKHKDCCGRKALKELGLFMGAKMYGNDVVAKYCDHAEAQIKSLEEKKLALEMLLIRPKTYWKRFMEELS